MAKFKGFHIKYKDLNKTASGESGMFCGGIVIDPTRTIVSVTVAPYAGKDFQVKPDAVVQVHYTIEENHHPCPTIAEVADLSTNTRQIEDAVVAFVHRQADKGPLGIAFLQALYAYLNTGKGYTMSSIRSDFQRSLRQAEQQQKSEGK